MKIVGLRLSCGYQIAQATANGNEAISVGLQPDPRLSTCFLRGADKYRPVIARTRWPQPVPAVSPRWRGPEQFFRLCSCARSAGSLYLTAKRVGHLPVFGVITPKMRCNAEGLE